MTPIDPISVIEAAYRLGGSDAAWMKGILEVVRPGWDDGLGVAMFEMSLDAQGRPSFGRTVFDSDRPDFFRETLLQMNQQIDDEAIEQTYRQVAICSTLSERMAPVLEDFREDAVYRELAHPHGFYDCLGIQIVDPSGTMLMLAAPCRQITATTAQQRHRWERLSAHIAAAYRLRRHYEIGDADVDGEEVDAVLSAEGRVLHLSQSFLAEDSSSPEQLELAAEAIGRARSEMRRSAPDDALELWRVLVEGRYSLVEHVDTDGKKMLLARRNDPATLSQPPGLDPSERRVIQFAVLGHSERLIGYELGVPKAAVERLLESGLEKLGLRSRIELMRLWDALSRQGVDEG